ncbi:MAG: zinc ribbon domain-containing protein [Terriglobales bacterium]
MHPDLNNLQELQVADREIARLNAEVASLPKKVAAIESQLADARQRKADAEAAIKAGESNRRKYESQIQDLQGKISKYRDQMLAVKTNQEYKALTQEIEFAQQHIREAEDKILELMVSAESLNANVKRAEADLKAETAEIEKEKAAVRARTEEDEKLLSEWNQKRNALRSGIGESTLRHYDRVQKLRGNALAEARDHRCGVCQVMLRPQVYNDVRTNEQIIICDSCHRILWYNPEREDSSLGQSSDRIEKAWYYLPNIGEHGAFVGMVNEKGNCACRLFDALDGHPLNHTVRHKGRIFQDEFADYLKAGTRMDVHPNPHIDEVKDGLPEMLLDDLKMQVPEPESHAEAATPPTAQ